MAGRAKRRDRRAIRQVKIRDVRIEREDAVINFRAADVALGS
jgi:hypothetical protein